MKISACMIIKNESELLPQCLQSIQWVDEIICVDTGSTDNSIEIAKKYGAKVNIHPWQNDFSFHRNQSIDYATGDWFITIDADEIIVLGTNPKNIKEYLANMPTDVSALITEITEISNGVKTAFWFYPKIFRKKDFIGYRKIVHNEPYFKNQSVISEIRFNHFGYSLNAEKMEKKIKRTKNLLYQRIRDNSEDYIAYLYMMQTLFYAEYFEEAEDCGIKYFYFAKKNYDSRYHEIAYYFMCIILNAIGKYRKSYSWGKKGLKSFPDSIDLNHAMAKTCFRMKSKKLFKQYTNKYLLELVMLRNSKIPKTICYTANEISRRELM